MKKAVFLDRDGVLSKTHIKKGKSFAVKKLKDFKLFYGSEESVKKLKLAGFMVIVVTNQPDVGKKIISRIVLKKMHDRLKKKTKVDAIYSCTHSQDDNCFCRKPKPGMILNAAKKHNINLKKSFMVGDRSSDILAGKKAKCRSIFLDKKYFEKKPKVQEATFNNLVQATNYILKQTQL
jgi:D-glycero-D-manno-heptose 1,7-bisphosphate phosphatase|tara:strand:- start:198 stop:731 length:534 start_codon:yes stop_codon:yes gene_type:complete